MFILKCKYIDQHSLIETRIVKSDARNTIQESLQTSSASSPRTITPDPLVTKECNCETVKSSDRECECAKHEKKVEVEVSSEWWKSKPQLSMTYSHVKNHEL